MIYFRLKPPFPFKLCFPFSTGNVIYIFSNCLHFLRRRYWCRQLFAERFCRLVGIRFSAYIVTWAKCHFDEFIAERLYGRQFTKVRHIFGVKLQHHCEYAENCLHKKEGPNSTSKWQRQQPLPSKQC